jgi:hypothetical protein
MRESRVRVDAKDKSKAALGTTKIIVTVVLAALTAFVFPAASNAVFAATVIPTVPPSPVQLVRVTVGVAVVPLVTATVQLDPPVVFKVTSPMVKLCIVLPA